MHSGCPHAQMRPSFFLAAPSSSRMYESSSPGWMSRVAKKPTCGLLLSQRPLAREGGKRRVVAHMQRVQVRVLGLLLHVHEVDLGIIVEVDTVGGPLRRDPLRAVPI